MAPTITVPLSLHEAAVERLYISAPRTGSRTPDPELDAAVAAMREARTCAEQAGRLAEALCADPTRTPAAAVVELHRVVPPVAERATKALDAATARLRRTMSELETSMAPPPPSSPEALAVAGEIRATLARAKDTAARNEIINAALAEQDAAVIGAVLRAPGVVSGIGAAQQRDLRRRWAAQQHPEAFNRAGRLDKALSALEHAGAGLLNFARAVTTPPGATEALAAAQAAEALRQAATTTEGGA